ncbi:hypothetical protein M422DRAFT_783306 [Sphaerobolus stellatus SS14]|uniref:Uncharacterized protein n=1 Tax=Sphaerobolus stellatus (strain SS14) TaxID=990650 RepID=A0A0C9V626_SPHS4|nr:hypothetical protein M422DRAFT_783306 [Sphaerobolus stellatus SS14]
MYHFDNICGPDGVSMRVYQSRMKKKIKDKKAELIEELYQHWKTPHTFDYLLGDNPSKLELKQAHRRVSAKLNALIGNRGQISKHGPDVFKILFEQVRRPSAKDIWAHEQEAIVGLMVLEEMVNNKWKPSMSRQKTLPIQMKARKKVFNRLPEAEKQIWRAKAAAWEPKPLIQKELFAALPKLLFTFGDTVRKYLKWTIFIWAGGLTDTGKAASIRLSSLFALWVFIIEWYDEDDADTQALLDSKEYQAVDTVFNGVLARKHKLPIEEVQTMLPYCPRIPNSIIPQGVPLLKDMIEYDPATNSVLTDNDTLIKALTLYLQDMYALVPTVDGKKRKGKQLIPPWDRMDQKKGNLGEWIEPGRLPDTPGFRFSAPTRMAEEDCHAFAVHVCSGEHGHFSSERVFCWRNQQKGHVVPSKKMVPAKRKIPSSVAAETAGISFKDVTAIATQPAEGASERPIKKARNIELSEKKVAIDTSQGQKPPPKARAKKAASKGAGIAEDPPKKKITVVHKGAKGPQFDGNGQEWYNDFHKIEVVRFLEASEVEAGVKFSAFLDISEKIEDSSASEEDAKSRVIADEIWDALFESEGPLPYPRHITCLKDWKGFAKEILLRIDAGLESICAHPCDRSLSRLRLGGGIGVFGILRALEFLRRVVRSNGMEEILGVFYHTLREHVCSLLKKARTVFQKEMWRRWTCGSLCEDPNNGTNRLVILWHVFMEAAMQKGMTDEEASILIK